jgi:hypothetical protein
MMRKIKVLLLALGILCTLSSHAQEEFFGHNTGLSLSGSSDFSAYSSGGLSLHLKNGLIFSGSFVIPEEGINIPTIATIGYLFDLNKKSERDKFHAIISLSDISFIPDFFQQVNSISPTLGFMYTSFHDVNFPTSLGISASAYFNELNFNYIAQSSLTFYFAQAFYAQKTVYPVIGVTYSLPLSNVYGNDQGVGSLLFHVGLNIRLSKPETNKLKE